MSGLFAARIAIETLVQPSIPALNSPSAALRLSFTWVLAKAAEPATLVRARAAIRSFFIG